jgi:hypothetical protein
MAIGHSLMIKYGLKGAPSEAKANEWVNLVQEYIRKGIASETAGVLAAKAIFPDYNTMVYASEADTIEALLREAGRR